MWPAGTRVEAIRDVYYTDPRTGELAVRKGHCATVIEPLCDHFDPKTWDIWVRPDGLRPGPSKSFLWAKLDGNDKVSTREVLADLDRRLRSPQPQPA